MQHMRIGIRPEHRNERPLSRLVPLPLPPPPQQHYGGKEYENEQVCPEYPGTTHGWVSAEWPRKRRAEDPQVRAKMCDAANREVHIRSKKIPPDLTGYKRKKTEQKE